MDLNTALALLSEIGFGMFMALPVLFIIFIIINQTHKEK